MQAAGARQVVTGLIVNQKVNVSRPYLQQVRGMVRSLETKGLIQAETDYVNKYRSKQSLSGEPGFAMVLVGRSIT